MRLLDGFNTVLPGIASQILHLRDQRRQVALDFDRVLDAQPLSEVLTSMPGIGDRIAARFLAETDGDLGAFPAAAHLAPVTSRSGTSIRREHVNRGGNKRLKNDLFKAGFASLRADPEYRAYYDRKRAEGKKHNAALICLARRKTDVLYAMVRAHRHFTPAHPKAA